MHGKPAGTWNLSLCGSKPQGSALSALVNLLKTQNPLSAKILKAPNAFICIIGLPDLHVGTKTTLQDNSESTKHKKRGFLSPLFAAQPCKPQFVLLPGNGTQQPSHPISESIAYCCHHGLKHGGRRRKFRRGQKVENNSEHYGDEKNIIQLV